MNSAQFRHVQAEVMKSRSTALEQFRKLDAAVVALGGQGLSGMSALGEDAIRDIASMLVLGVLSERRMRESDIAHALASFGLPNDTPFIEAVLSSDSRIVRGRQGWWSTSVVVQSNRKAKAKEETK